MTSGRLAIIGFGIIALCLAACCGEETAADKALLAKLEKPVNFRIRDVAAARALELLAEQAGVAIRIDDPRKNEVFKTSLTLAVEGVRALDILDVICALTKLEFKAGGGAVTVSPGHEMDVVLRIYDVDDLIRPIPDFMQIPVPPGIICGPLPPPALANIADMIRNRVRPECWDAALGTSIEERGGKLVVMQTEEIHGLVQELLDTFRAVSRRQVGLELRFVCVKSTELDRIRREVAKRGTAWPELDDEALAAVESKATPVFSGTASAYNTQRVAIQNVKWQQYLADYEISGDYHDSVVRRFGVGTIFDLDPLLSDDAKLVTLTIRPTHTALSRIETVEVLRGGAITTAGARGRIIFKRSKPVAPPGDAKDAPEPPEKKPEEAKPAEAKKAEQEEFTGEIVSPTESKTLALEPLQMQLPTLGLSRVRTTLVARAGKWTAVTAPMTGKDGLVHGQELVALIRCTPQMGAPAGASKKEAPARKHEPMSEALKAKLRARVELFFDDMPFEWAVGALAAQLNLPVVLDVAAFNANKLEQHVNLDAREMKGSEALAEILKVGKAVMIPYPSLILLSTGEYAAVAAAAARKVSLRIFDIRDLTTSLPDFPGPKVLPEHESGPADPFAAASAPAVMHAADFATLIKDKMFPAEFADPGTSIEESGGKLVVMQTPEVHAKIEKELAKLRDATRRRVAVTARWAVVKAADLKREIGADTPPVLDAERAQKALELISRPESKDIAATRITSFSGQRVHSLGGAQSSFVSDYDISGSVPDPVIRSYLEGAILDVLANVAGGGGPSPQIEMDLRLNLASAEKPGTMFDPSPPRKQPEVPPAGDAAKGNAPSRSPVMGKINTPTVHVQPVECTVRVPDGGAALFVRPVPAWLPGEDAEAARKGERVLMILVQAEQLKY